MALIECKECGKEMSEKATTCPNCGYKNINNKEKASFGILAVCFIIPIAGIILFIINISSKPKYAKQCIISSGIAFIIAILITITSVVLIENKANSGMLMKSTNKNNSYYEEDEKSINEIMKKLEN